MMRMIRLVALLSACLLVLTCVASAELVVNGGFETHDLTGWTTAGDTTHIFVCGTGAAYLCNQLGGFQQSGAPHSGDNALAFGPDPTGSIQQTLSTIPGFSYNLSFWVENCVDYADCLPNSLTVSWGGTNIYSQSNLNSFGWTEFTLNNLQASSSNTVLQFSGNNVGSFFLIDDIGVVEAPEPAGILLMGGGLAGAASFVRRKLA